jgi:hypothetical protein
MRTLSIQRYINGETPKTHNLVLPKPKIVKDPNGDIWGLNGDNVSSGIHISKWKLKKPKYIVFFQRAIGDDFQHMGCHKSLYSAMKQATQLYYDNPELCLANIREANMKLYNINQDIAEPPLPRERDFIFSKRERIPSSTPSFFPRRNRLPPQRLPQVDSIPMLSGPRTTFQTSLKDSFPTLPSPNEKGIWQDLFSFKVARHIMWTN